MSRYQIGVIMEPWIDIEPPISSKEQGESKSHNDVSELLLDGLVHSSSINSQKPSKPTAIGDEMFKNTAQAFINIAEKQDIEKAIRNYPSLDPETQREITRKFRELHTKVREYGLYDCRYSQYGLDILRYLLLFGLFIYSFANSYYLVSSCFLGCFWQQIMFAAHDSGHLAITHDIIFDTIIGIFVADLCCGLSIGWWKSSHNVHHLVPNHPVSHKTIFSFLFYLKM